MIEPHTPIPQPPSDTPPAPPAFQLDELLRGPAAILVAILLLAAVTLALQATSGAWRGEFGGHPDEAAHYVTSLMMRDYVFGGGFPQNPMKFAQNYYNHYPRVALGHYPPGFYLMTAPWMAIFGTSTYSIMGFMALLSTMLALSGFLMARRRWDFLTALLAGAGVAVLPLTQRYTSLVMSDLALGLFCLAGAWAFGRFVATGKLRWSVAFGLLASCAAMIKGSGLMMALVPPAVILLAWRWDVLLNWRLWVAPPIVGILVVPWTKMTYAMANEGMQPWTPDYPVRSISFLLGQLRLELGWALLATTILGLVFILRPLFLPRTAEGEKRGLAPDDASMVAFPLCLLAFYTIVPSGFDERYLLPAVPACLVLTAWGIQSLAHLLAPRRPRTTMIAGALATVVAIVFFALTFRVPDKNFHGFHQVAEVVHGEFGDRLKSGSKERLEVLISSDANGEGAFIAEMAQMDRHRPTYTVQRASKMLASSDWLGRGYKTTFSDAPSLATGLRNSQVTWIVRDEESIKAKLGPHHILLGQALELPSQGSAAGIPPTGFSLVQQSFSITRKYHKAPTPLLLYRRVGGKLTTGPSE